MPPVPLRFRVLGSGSRGNSLLVECGATRILVDCGFPLREIELRLERAQVAPGSVSALLLTHEHGDHAQGALAFARRHPRVLFTTRGTFRALARKAKDVDVRFIESGRCFAVGAIDILPYVVPHDACEPVQFVFSSGGARLGLLTDVGSPTPYIEECLRQCDGLILECNHEAELLQSGAYPPSLKARIGGRFGHLSNAQAAGILSRVMHPGLQCLVAAHLSAQNNRPDLARQALGSVLGDAASLIEVADQDLGLEWRALGVGVRPESVAWEESV